MVAVALSPEAVGEYLNGEVDVAAINEPGGCVVAGSEEGIRQFSERLTEKGIVARRVRTGTYGINGMGMDFSSPFGGFKQSGVGRELGPEGLEAFLESKTIVLPAGFEPS